MKYLRQVAEEYNEGLADSSLSPVDLTRRSNAMAQQLFLYLDIMVSPENLWCSSEKAAWESGLLTRAIIEKKAIKLYGAGYELRALGYRPENYEDRYCFFTDGAIECWQDWIKKALNIN